MLAEEEGSINPILNLSLLKHITCSSVLFQGNQMMIRRNSYQLQSLLTTLVVSVFRAYLYAPSLNMGCEIREWNANCVYMLKSFCFFGCFCSSCLFKCILEESGARFRNDHFRREVVLIRTGDNQNN